jgi:PTS system cellobiose-specific IIC component
LIAGTVIILSAWAFTDLLNVDLHTVFSNLLSPLMSIFGNFWGWTLVMSIAPLLFYFGIHPMSVLPIVTPIYYASLASNVQLLSSGLEPTVANGFFVANVATWLLLNIGGAGSTLGLNLLMLFSKNKAVKKLGQLAIVPSILNINEPVIFGLPILFNPVLFVPFVLGTLVNSSITYLVMNWGWVAIPSTFALASYVPAPINAYILTQDVKAVILILALIAIDMVIWAPFLKMHEKALVAAKETAA